jgi:cell volume regulation protein A
MFFTFSFTDAIGGNGFLAIYGAGIILGNASIIHKKSLIKFFDGIAWLMQIVMFLTLGLLVYPSQITPLIGEGLLISLFLIVSSTTSWLCS